MPIQLQTNTLTAPFTTADLLLVPIVPYWNVLFK